jgi:putative acetyltransferase
VRTIGYDDPRADDVRALLEAHLSFARTTSPPEDVHALDVEGLVDPAVMFFSLRVAGEVLAVGALKRLSASHVELKSMHTAAAVRGQGLGRAMLLHLLSVARSEGYRRVSLETGSMTAFAPARGLYASMGFVPCEPFGRYQSSDNSSFMTLALDPPSGPGLLRSD